ncbi:MAG: DUF481 domain-containing protein [Terriglobales bacterium]
MHKKLVVGLFLLLMVWMTVPAAADQVVLKNGDRLTGSITKSDGKSLVLKTDAMGDVTVKFDAIQSITTTGDLNVSLGGKTVVGPVTTSGENLVVATKTAGTVEAPKASVTMMRDPAEEAAYQKKLHPGLLEGWNGGVNLGFAFTAGNSESRNLNIAFNAVRTGFHDKLTLYTNTIYATSSKPVSVTTANTNSGGIRYDHDFSACTFGFGSGDFFSNSLQDLDLRTILTGGVGFHAVKSANTTIDLLAGVNYTHESFSGLTEPNPPPDFYSPSDSSAALTLGDTFMHKLGKSTVVTQSFFLYPSLTETTFTLPNNLTENERVLRGAFNLGVVTKLNKWLGWQMAFGDVFDNHPPYAVPPIERNDITFATGLNFAFTH